MQWWFKSTRYHHLPINMPYHLDYETRSRADIKTVGAFRYAADSSTEIFCAAVAKDNGPPLLWVNPKFHFTDEWGVTVKSDPGADALIREMLDSDEPVYAHNAQFEHAVTMYVLSKLFGKGIDLRRWRCTAAMARRAGLPFSLKDCAEALGLRQQKDNSGWRLINLLSIPDKKSGKFNEPRHNGAEFKKFCDYCRQDVRVEQEIHSALRAFELKGFSLETFQMEMAINTRGLPVNVEAVRYADQLVQEATAAINEEFTQITGLNPTQRDKFIEWLRANGAPIKNMRAATVDEALQAETFDDSTPTGRALTLKKQVSFSSVAKLPSILDTVCDDGRVRGTLMYYGAVRTGRFAGRLVQPQNMKKPSAHLESYTKDIYDLICARASREEIELMYGPVIEAVGSCIRHFIQDPAGHMLNSDYTAIEAVVLSHLAEEEWRLEVFRTHGKIYEASASQMFGVPLDQITKPLRQKGKLSELSLGYQGGTGALEAMGALKMGLKKDELPDIVAKWREANSNIVNYWWRSIRQAEAAVKNPGGKFNVRHDVCYFSMKVAGIQYLFCKLPSGRNLAYPHCKIEPVLQWSEKGKFFKVFSPTQEQVDHALEVDAKAWHKEAALTFEGYKTSTKSKASSTRVELTPGSAVENQVQAIATDVMCIGCLNAEKAGYETITLVHDEWLGYLKPGQEIDELNRHLTTLPAWADGMPVKAKGGVVPYYLKD